eukprot:Rhum_TRINITY_DN14503_c11_g3::Rhum_TRINITY_DN14503_c11_g3_i1::g.95708::m.95708
MSFACSLPSGVSFASVHSSDLYCSLPSRRAAELDVPSPWRRKWTIFTFGAAASTEATGRTRTRERGRWSCTVGAMATRFFSLFASDSGKTRQESAPWRVALKRETCGSRSSSGTPLLRLKVDSSDSTERPKVPSFELTNVFVVAGDSSDDSAEHEHAVPLVDPDSALSEPAPPGAGTFSGDAVRFVIAAAAAAVVTPADEVTEMPWELVAEADEPTSSSSALSVRAVRRRLAQRLTATKAVLAPTAFHIQRGRSRFLIPLEKSPPFFTTPPATVTPFVLRLFPEQIFLVAFLDNRKEKVVAFVVVVLLLFFSFFSFCLLLTPLVGVVRGGVVTQAIWKSGCTMKYRYCS